MLRVQTRAPSSRGRPLVQLENAASDGRRGFVVALEWKPSEVLSRTKTWQRRYARAMSMSFRKFSHAVSAVVGKPVSFAAAVAVVLVWAGTGPYFHYSDTWQLVINTGTTVVTFLMVFLIQSTQNRDTLTLQLKLDELIRAHTGARNKLVDLEEMSDEELTALEHEFRRVRRESVAEMIEAIQENRDER